MTVHNRPIAIFPYSTASKSYKGLRRKLPCYRPTNNMEFENKLVINWGLRNIPYFLLEKNYLLNHPYSVRDASNKSRAFHKLHEGGISIPDFTTSGDTARHWMEEGRVVLARHSYGYGGEDILFSDELTQKNSISFFEKELFTTYVPKKEEYRVHVFSGKVIDVQRKALRKTFEGNPVDTSEVNFRVRSYGNGFVFIRGGISPDEKVLSEAVKAVEVLSLDFGAVDVIWNESKKTAYVLEVNTAPGLEGTTLNKYAEEFIRVLSSYEESGYKSKDFPKENEVENSITFSTIIGVGDQIPSPYPPVLVNPPSDTFVALEDLKDDHE